MMDYRTFTKQEVEAALFQRKALQEFDDVREKTIRLEYIKKINAMLSERRVYTYRNNGSKILMVYPHDYFVKNHYLYFKNFMDFFSQYDSLYYSIKEDGIRASYKRDRRWLIESSLKAGYIFNMLYTYILSEFPVFLDYWEEIDLRRYNLVVLYNEMSPISSFIVYRCQQVGVKTATLQHGQMVGASEIRSGFKGSGHMLKDSRVDYFLGWNKFTKEEALRSGMSEKKFILTGMPGYVGRRKEIIKAKKNKVIGVIFCENYELNKRVIKIVEEYACKNGYKYTIRYRPLQNKSEYNGLVDNNHIELIGADTVMDFASMVEFTVSAPSSCFDELVMLGAEVYRLRCDDDVYASLDCGAVDSADTLDSLRKRWDKIKEIYTEYIGLPVDSDERYRAFFKKYE